MNAPQARLRPRLYVTFVAKDASAERTARGLASRAAAWAREHAAFALLLCGLLAIWAGYAYMHWFLCDDAFVSFRYARNLWRGHGLVWNIGERVEGYTNFLWVIELAFAHVALGARPDDAALTLSVLCTLGVFWATAKLAWSTPFAGERQLSVLLALGALVVNRNFAVWTSGGLETRQFTLLVLLAVLGLQQKGGGATRYVPAAIALGLAELTRPEANMLFGCAFGFLVLQAAVTRRWRIRELAGFALPYLAIVGAHTLFRYAYYGELVPNTYYAKDVRPWLWGGSHYVITAVIENGLYLLWPLALLGMVVRLTLRRDPLHLLSLVLLVPHTLYLVRIGGDHFEFRPFDVHWPLLALACADGLLALGAWGLRIGRRWLPEHAQVIGWCTTAVAALIALAYGTVLQLAQYVTTYDLDTRAATRGLLSKVEPKTFPAALILPGMKDLLEPYNAAQGFTSQHSIGLRWPEHHNFYRQQSAAYDAYRKFAVDLFPRDAVMAIGTIGVIGYALGDLTLIDVHGLTDRTVAHNPVLAANRDRQLAHDRSPPPGYLEKRGVNLDVHPVARAFDGATDYALRLPDGRFMPLATKKPDWLRRTFASRGLWMRELSTRLESNRVMVEGKMLEPIRKLGFFDDGTLEGWTGSGVIIGPTTKLPKDQMPVSGQVGVGFIDSYVLGQGDSAQGDLQSPAFTAQAGHYLVFLVGGGNVPGTGVQVLAGDKVIATRRGHNAETLGMEAVDLTPYAGQSCQVRIVDSTSAGWGHVLADHFMVMREAK